MLLRRFVLFAATGFLIGYARAAEPIGYWQGEATHSGQTWPVGVRIERAEPAPTVELDFPAFGVFGHRSGSLTVDGDQVRFGSFVRDDRLRFAARVSGDEMRGTLDGFGITAEFSAKRESSAPPKLQREDLAFHNGAIQLAGTLILPPGSGPHPAIVLMHGSGPQGRTTTLYSSLAVFFARNRVAALIYDKRGVGKSTGEWQTTSLTDLAMDALAGVEALRQRPDIAAGRVGCGGASQGGWLAPLCASLSEHVAFVVVNSAPGVTPAEQNNFNCETDLVAAGLPRETIEEALRLRGRTDEYFTTGVLDAALNQDLRNFRQRHASAEWCETWIHEPPLPPAGPGTENHYTANYMLLDPVTIWPRISVPVLAQWGEDDRLVPAVLSRDIIQSCLRSAGNERVRLVVHPAAGHGIGATRDSEGFSWPRLAPGYLPEISDWISKELTNGAGN